MPRQETNRFEWFSVIDLVVIFLKRHPLYRIGIGIRSIFSIRFICGRHIIWLIWLQVVCDISKVNRVIDVKSVIDLGFVHLHSLLFLSEDWKMIDKQCYVLTEFQPVIQSLESINIHELRLHFHYFRNHSPGVFRIKSCFVSFFKPIW